ncbi:MAG: YggT family protein [Pseudomonadota bacterium]
MLPTTWVEGLSLVFDVLILLIVSKLVIMWLIRFEVLNVAHPFVAGAQEKIQAIFRPIYDAVRRVIPPVFGIDVAPIATIIIFISLKQALRYFFA